MVDGFVQMMHKATVFNYVVVEIPINIIDYSSRYTRKLREVIFVIRAIYLFEEF